MMVRSDRRGALDQRQILALFGVQMRIQQNLRQADNPVHRSADLMAHVSQEFALGAVGGFGGFLGFQQLRFGLFARRDVHRMADDVADGARWSRSGPKVKSMIICCRSRSRTLVSKRTTSPCSRAHHHISHPDLLVGIVTPARRFPEQFAQNIL